MSGPLPRARHERLPVNPRRNKVPPESRKRVARACNACNVRRAKCVPSPASGFPCDRCQKAARECIYPAVEETVTIRKSEYEALLRGSVDCARRQSESSSGTERGQTNPFVDHNGPADQGHSNHEADSLREGRLLEDSHGSVRYLGESSGATFLNHLRQFMASVIPMSGSALQSTEIRFIAALGRYQTHDSKALPLVSDDPHRMPPRDEALRMVTELRRWTRDGGLYYWTDFDALMAEYDRYLDSPTAHDKRTLALLNATFAVACQLNPACSPQCEPGGGQVFFARARSLLGNPLDTASLTDANVLTLLGFYLLNSNRRDAAYMYVSIALHIYSVHGIHRGWLIGEDGKRKFWDAYNLDRWLSCLQGRPAIVPEEAIKLDAPRDAPGLPPADGLRVHIELSKITYYIAANVYGISKNSAEPRTTALCLHKSLHMLKEWEEELPPSLRYQHGRMDQERAAYDLKIAVNHLKVLAVRPWLFDSVRAHTTSICLRGRRDSDILHREEIDAAVEAARQTIDLMRSLDGMRKQTYLVHTVIHHAFNAALALELNRILSPLDLPSDREDVLFVITSLSSQLGGNRPFAVDCGEVLSDLGVLVDKLCEIAQSLVGPPDFGHSTTLLHIWDAPRYHGLGVPGRPS